MAIFIINTRFNIINIFYNNNINILFFDYIYKINIIKYFDNKKNKKLEKTKS